MIIDYWYAPYLLDCVVRQPDEHSGGGGKARQAGSFYGSLPAKKHIGQEDFHYNSCLPRLAHLLPTYVRAYCHTPLLFLASSICGKIFTLIHTLLTLKLNQHKQLPFYHCFLLTPSLDLFLFRYRRINTSKPYDYRFLWVSILFQTVS